MEKFREESFRKEYDFIIDKYLGNFEVTSSVRKNKEREVDECDILLDLIPYTCYRYYDSFLFVPKNIDFNGDLKPVYSLGKNELGFYFSSLSKKDLLLEERTYSYLNNSMFKENYVDAMLSCSCYMDKDNELLELFNSEKMTEEIFFTRRDYLKILAKNKNVNSIIALRNEDNAYFIELDGSREDSFINVINGNIDYKELILNDESMFSKVDNKIDGIKLK